jgi:hypothetical protein
LSSIRQNVEKAGSGLLVIAAGVLMALWADSAWENRLEALREQEVLGDLLTEFRENETRLRADIEASLASRAAGRAWSLEMREGGEMSPDSLSSLWVHTFSWARFDPVTGALRSVLDGGELRLISNQQLRQALAGWTDRAFEARLSSEGTSSAFATVAPTVLTAEAGHLTTMGQRAGVATIEAFAGGPIRQLVPLLEELTAIVELIEGEIKR